MNSPRFTPEFKEEAVRQIVERGYSVAEVSERLGVSTHSLYKWVKAIKPDKTDEQAADLLAALTSRMESELDQVIDIQIENYRESLKLTQRAIFFGLFIAGTAHYLDYVGKDSDLPKLPFFFVEFSSLETLQITLLVLYLGSGFLSWFAIINAHKNLKDIKSSKIEIAVSKHPCLAVTNFWFGGLLAGALLGIGAMLLMSIYEFTNIYQKSLYFVVALPYWSTLRVGSIINSWDKRVENRE